MNPLKQKLNQLCPKKNPHISLIFREMLTPFCLKSKLKALQNSQKAGFELKLTKINFTPFLVILLGISDLLSLAE